MGNSIKDIINTFKNDLDEVITPPAKKENKGKGTKQKTVALKTKAVEEEVKTPATKTQPERVGEDPEEKNPRKRAITQEFFDTLGNLEFSFEDRKTTFIDSDLYEIIVMLKHKKKIKSVAVLFNAIVKQFVEDNKKEIQKILSNTKI
jgi:hypothetical protein